MGKKSAAQQVQIADLQRQLREAKAAQVHNYRFADQGLNKAGPKYMGASGVIITLTALGGRELIPPTMLVNGLSDELIAALRTDLVRSYEYVVAMKPQGASNGKSQS